MTLIAFACYGDRVEFVTDSLWYTKRVEQIGLTSKHITLPHLSAAVLSQGDSLFGDHAKSAAMQASDHCATFDELVAEMPQHFIKAWSDLLEDDPQRSIPAVFMLGWSDAEQEFVAYMYASEQSFKPIRLKQPFATPMNYHHRPSPMELRRLRKDWSDGPAQVAAMDTWSTKEPLTAPKGIEGWIKLAQDCREHRSLDGAWARVLVAGDLFHTTLSRDELTTRRVFSFDDSGDEFNKMVEYTQHPIALASACWCGNGQTYGACHGRMCSCESGELWGLCHGEAQTLADSERVGAARP